ncbi:hypothetical protein L1787_02415 [Acuticoccus sp. M5D2P5]|uniref:hypothetical protein n=1 Tax=Acuticoccus kalidii TaxID=2910977 RepID=UPI001F399A7F|nr:hypothetical protein [Acuticoccus kalidii]MCF3932269.1 hypothetical protein [Acuticoccus kalidii]
MRAAFVSEMNAAADEGLDGLLSAETGSAMQRAGVAELHELMSMFDKVVTLAFVRPPRSWRGSKCQQGLKDGGTMADFLTSVPAALYRGSIEPHDKVSPNVRLAVFHPSRMKDGCVLQTLLSMMDGERPAFANARAGRSNESMSMTGAKFFSMINGAQKAGALPADLPDALRRALGEGLMGDYLKAVFAEPRFIRPPNAMMRVLIPMPGPKFRLPVEVEAAAIKAEGDEIAWICDRLGEDLTAFDSDTDTPLPTLASFDRFDDEEVAAIVTTIETMNATITDPIEALLARGRKGKRRRVERYLNENGIEAPAENDSKPKAKARPAGRDAEAPAPQPGDRAAFREARRARMMERRAAAVEAKRAARRGDKAAE